MLSTKRVYTMEISKKEIKRRIKRRSHILRDISEVKYALSMLEIDLNCADEGEPLTPSRKLAISKIKDMSNIFKHLESCFESKINQLKEELN